jgi:hypothetical protein
VVVVGETLAEPEVPEAVKPVPVQEVALVDDQVKVEAVPEGTVVGLAVREAVGAGGAVPVIVKFF